MDLADWWCDLFGYGSCSSMPFTDELLLWGGTWGGFVLITFVVVNWALDR
jgi:hypothetical protein